MNINSIMNIEYSQLDSYVFFVQLNPCLIEVRKETSRGGILPDTAFQSTAVQFVGRVDIDQQNSRNMEKHEPTGGFTTLYYILFVPKFMQNYENQQEIAKDHLGNLIDIKLEDFLYIKSGSFQGKEFKIVSIANFLTKYEITLSETR